jgi:hypothetical protein
MTKRLLTPTLLAFATALFIVPAASAMPMIDPGPVVTPQAYVIPSPNATDGWYQTALRQTRLDRQALRTDGWYPAALRQTRLQNQVLRDGWYPAAVRQTRIDRQAPFTDGWLSAVTAVTHPVTSSTPAPAASSSRTDFPFRNAGLVLAFGLLIAALVAWAVVRSRHERHVPVLQ